MHNAYQYIISNDGIDSEDSYPYAEYVSCLVTICMLSPQLITVYAISTVLSYKFSICIVHMLPAICQ